jgi:hypothetical protein
VRFFPLGETKNIQYVSLFSEYDSSYKSVIEMKKTFNQKRRKDTSGSLSFIYSSKLNSNNYLKTKKLNSEGADFYYYDLKSNKSGKLTVSLDNLIFHYNVGIEVIGNIGLKILDQFQNIDSIIVAYNTTNPFTSGLMRQVDWSKTNKPSIKPSVKVPEDAKAKYQYLNATFNNYKLELIKIRNIFKNGYENERFELIVLKNGKSIWHIKGQGDYSYPPSKIWFGPLLKKRGPVLFTTEAGEGDCGHFIILSTDDVKNIELTCGNWGC